MSESGTIFLEKLDSVVSGVCMSQCAIPISDRLELGARQHELFYGISFAIAGYLDLGLWCRC